MNIWIRGSFFASPIACVRYAACCDSVTPFGSPGFVSLPYSVIQIGMFFRLNEASRSFSNWPIVENVTFGYFVFWVGACATGNGYGCCAQASNLSRGFALATSFMNVPGRTVSVCPATILSRPFDEVSPIATCAVAFPALMPAYPAAASFA